MDEKKIFSDNSNRDKVETNTILPRKANPIKESNNPSSNFKVPIPPPPPIEDD